MVNLKNNRDGFTLVEILVALAVAGVVMAGIYSAYYSQQKSYIAQGEMTNMQQNLRAAMYFMEREIRMAGCDPHESAGAGITNAGSTTISFSEDVTDDTGTGDPDGDVNDANENITYALDGTNLELKRNNVAIAHNIEVLDFVYLDEDGGIATNNNDIRAVQITLVARTGRGDPGYVNSDTFINQKPDGPQTILGPQNDNFRRKSLTAQIKCRNLGL